MLSGTHWRQLDAKGRMVLPASFRAELGANCVMTLGVGGCLWLFARDQWLEWVEPFAGLDPTDVRDAARQKRLLAWALQIAVDRMGRILIPAELRESAGLSDEVAVVGMGKRVEIWQKTRWAETVGELGKQ